MPLESLLPLYNHASGVISTLGSISSIAQLMRQESQVGQKKRIFFEKVANPLFEGIAECHQSYMDIFQQAKSVLDGVDSGLGIAASQDDVDAAVREVKELLSDRNSKFWWYRHKIREEALDYLLHFQAKTVERGYVWACCNFFLREWAPNQPVITIIYDAETIANNRKDVILSTPASGLVKHLDSVEDLRSAKELIESEISNLNGRFGDVNRCYLSLKKEVYAD